jgi:hypothetical protein
MVSILKDEINHLKEDVLVNENILNDIKKEIEEKIFKTELLEINYSRLEEKLNSSTQMLD